MNLHRKVFLIPVIVGIILSFSENTSAQNKTNYIRIASIVVDSTKLEIYRAALKEEIETSVQVETGVLSLNAVYDKERPSHVTVFEIYADMDGYKAHIQTPHFKKYKTAVDGIVKSLILTDVMPIALHSKKEL